LDFCRQAAQRRLTRRQLFDYVQLFLNRRATAPILAK
jgi:hypothetical protein